MQEASGLDLDDASMAAVQAQLANLTGSISDLTGSSQELIMTSVNEGLDAHEGKVIRIVSLSQDGSILSLGDGSHMQILGEDGLQVGGEIKVKLKHTVITHCYYYSIRESSTLVYLHIHKYACMQWVCLCVRVYVFVCVCVCVCVCVREKI